MRSCLYLRCLPLLFALAHFSAQAAQLFNSPITPRGWQAAHQASEALLAKLKERRLQTAVPQSQPLTQPERNFETPEPTVAQRQQSSTSSRPLQKPQGYYTARQLVLPGLALSLISAFLGWVAGAKSAPAAPQKVPAEETTGLQQEDSDITPKEASSHPLETSSLQQESGITALEQASPQSPAQAAEAAQSPYESGIQAAKEDEKGEEDLPQAACEHFDSSPEPSASVQPESPSGSGMVQSEVSPGWLQARREAEGAPLLPESALDDVAVVMAALVQRLKLDMDKLLPQERLQLLQMALQCCQHRENSWLHIQANEIHWSHAAAAHGHASIAHSTLAHKQQQVAALEGRRQVERFEAALHDGMLAGLVLMLGILLFCGIRCGFLGTQIGRCRQLSSLPAVTFWRPWAALEFFGILMCWCQAGSDALLGSCIMLGTAYFALKGSALKSSPHHAPLLKLAVGMGLICGFAGYCAVGRLGGDRLRWLTCWEGWVGMHCLAAWQTPALHTALTTGAGGPVKMLLYQGCISFLLPLAIAISPFQDCHWQMLSLLLAPLRSQGD